MYLIFRFYANALSINATQHRDNSPLPGDTGLLWFSFALDMCQAMCTGVQSLLHAPAQ